MNSSSKVSVMITTLNRVDDLAKTLEFLRSLNPPPFEVLVTADGCWDATVQTIRRTFPEVRLIVNEQSMGSVASRHRMMQEAKGDLILALDDDSHPEQVDCIARLAGFFEKNPKLAIATFPQRTDEYPETLERRDFGQEMPVRSFANSGACLRVATYRLLPGFEPMFFHMYEEPDYALQCVAAGWEVRYIPQITIRHHWVGRERSEIRNHHRHARNEFWSTLMRCPMPYALMLCAYRLFSQARFAVKRGPSWVVQEPIWWWQAVCGLAGAWNKRKPVVWSGYRKWLNLPDKGF
jgi:GT2 family glycosyltransferase